METKKIFYIAHIRLPTEKAHGMQIMKSCEAFARTGAEVELVVPRRKNPLEGDPFAYYAVEKNFTLTHLPFLDTIRFGRLGFLLALGSFLLVTRIYMFGKKGMVYTREEGVGFFFAHFVLETHTLSESLGFIRRFMYRKAKAHIVLTSFIKKGLRELGVPEQCIFISPDAVDLAQFALSISQTSAREHLNLPLDKKIVLYAGSFFLYNWKGVDTLLDAVKEFGEDCLCVLIGGSEKEVAEAKATWGRVNTLFLGYQPPQSIPLYLKTADVLVIPNKAGTSVSERYTSPLKLFEYMASERPIVASDLPSLREVVGEEEVALFNPSDARDLARKVRGLLQDPERGERLSQNARRKVEQFTWDMRVKTILQRLRELR